MKLRFQVVVQCAGTGLTSPSGGGEIGFVIVRVVEAGDVPEAKQIALLETQRLWGERAAAKTDKAIELCVAEVNELAAKDDRVSTGFIFFDQTKRGLT